MDVILETLPLIITVIVPPLFAAARSWFAAKIPSRAIPIILPIAGGVVGALANLTGVDASMLQTTSIDPSLWQTVVTGILTGFASNGLHQAWTLNVPKNP